MIMRTMFKFLILQFAFSYSLNEGYSSTYAPTHTPPTSPPTHTPPTTYHPTTAGPSTYPSPATTSPDPYGCPVGWVQSTEGCFLFHHTGINITDLS